MIYIVPCIFVIILCFALIKRVPVYDSFVTGAKESFNLIISLLPYLAGIFMLLEVFRISGLSVHISNFLSYPLRYLGIPKELCELLILRPLSGSGSLAVVESILTEHGADSYIARCASVIMASNDTIFYVIAVYLSTSKDKSSGPAVWISLVSSLFGAVVACLLCKVM